MKMRKRAAMETICRQYLDIGRDYGFATPAVRADLAGKPGTDRYGRLFRGRRERRQFRVSRCAAEELWRVFGESCHLWLDELPRGMPTILVTRWLLTKALEFHAWQAEKLADTGVDSLLAATLPAFSEATGPCLSTCRHR